MTQLPCEKRRFPLRLDRVYRELFELYLLWYRSLLIRIGRETTDELWGSVFDHARDDRLEEILAEGWVSASDEASQPLESHLQAALELQFSTPVEGVTAPVARTVVENAAPLPQLRALGPQGLKFQKEIGTYDALHIGRHHLARLAEALLDRYGKAGELIAYDTMLEEIRLADMDQLSVEEFIARRRVRFSTIPKKLDMHAAGLEVELIHAADDEIVNHVHHCEWARYYRDNHPRVGYLLSCSVDDAAYRAINPRLRLRRTTTLMEGGDKCDFRIFAVDSDDD